MPIPTFDSKPQQQAAEANRAGETCSTGQADLASFAALDGSVSHFDPKFRETPASEQGERPLSKEEIDRLYEERMEDEYAKREGGA
ncbi:hypothetical protein POX_a01481 [Penicillium oxalicum]|uniref:Uncharacterized protein n=1 Tax=Penicillium oxalicum (strain 114-2 / CGMCC 5302) TaxID=933388 RepID=S8B3Y5_PENO1|nr:hypothetical protein POX_a01481 [Penicillium oxalicum]EPS33523.1 hypothetical protein PDE_08485 [Penicillium oxalicum 114-2]KAI2794880.1 hypothetical protein POX_a01481 [Penicillium oxalicum]